MTWFKVDDSFYDHPKIANLGMAARGLWVTAGSYCSRHLTDGHVTKKQVRAFGGTQVQVRDLIANRVWIVCESHNDCYVFHDWIDMQPTRESELDRRAKQAERKQRSRGRKPADQPQPENVTRDQGVTVTRDDHVPLARVAARGRRPDPTRPVTTSSLSVSPEQTRATENESEPGTEVVAVGGTLVVLDDARPDPRRRIEIPDDWHPNDMHRARFPNVDHTEQADAFRDHAISVGRMCAGRAGWDSAFMSWLRKAPTTRRSTTDDRIRDALRVGEKYHEPDDQPDQQQPAIDYRRYLQ
ncbi:replication initiation protein [Gordonia phage Kroos]|uniref:Helix-turn-helix DNA binding domain protein n=2 Tax=Kroosvirus TaxID=2948789 RepID=A0A7G8LMA4_9CAUD|nr:replication initiation protein [Gordonia phage Kroos]YP_010001764.1 replication initiation protein [Gordonia phage YorkOnyx]AYR03033.1 hypothetical protein SEA_KROOS_54 [Gordonia phage Kroos]QNJ58376.1 hypothetical protein SEA_YORKONYX_55 [Gordonia phage YorkOnyx]WMI33063.1 hypothetical protein SEA_SCHOTTB_52 [Gordonia Phage SchottB]